MQLPPQKGKRSSTMKYSYNPPGCSKSVVNDYLVCATVVTMYSTLKDILWWITFRDGLSVMSDLESTGVC